jgi:hypothetical protein
MDLRFSNFLVFSEFALHFSGSDYENWQDFTFCNSVLRNSNLRQLTSFPASCCNWFSRKYILPIGWCTAASNSCAPCNCHTGWEFSTTVVLTPALILSRVCFHKWSIQQKCTHLKLFSLSVPMWIPILETKVYCWLRRISQQEDEIWLVKENRMHLQ